MASPSSNNNEVPIGNLAPSSTWGEFNNIMFAVQQAMGKMQTATMVRIESCTNSGGLSPVGYVDVTPLVNQLDGAGNPMPHETIYNIPYVRLQGGTNGIIMDPVKGDVGMCVFASRDISKVKKTKKQGNPGSRRQFSFSDGMYIGGIPNAAPTQYVQFSSAGIKIYSPVAVTIEAPNVAVSAATASVTATTSATVTAPTISAIASTLAKITAPVIQLGATGQTLLSFVTSAFLTLFNQHTHPDPVSGNTGTPTQQAGASVLTSTVTGA